MKTLTAKLNIALMMVAICLPGPVLADSAESVKSDSLKYLQDLRFQNVHRLQEIDKTLSRKIEEAQPSQIDAEISHLKMAKKEHVLRQEFLDRLIFQIDTKFRGGDMKAFLERALVDMAKIDAVGTNSESSLWKFLRNAADAVRRLPEQKENILSFLEGYMNRSVSNPVHPEEYISSRNYTNGAASESGRPLDRDQVGAIADERLREMNQTVKARANTPAEVH